MNSKTLYQAIGPIEDDYILEALEEKKHSINKIYLMGTLVASILILFAINAFNTDHPQVNFNNVQLLNTKEVAIDKSDFIKVDESGYLGDFEMSKTLESLELINQVTDLYLDKNNVVVYDKFEFFYSGLNKETLLVTTSKIAKRSYMSMEDKVSIINNKKVYLGISDSLYGKETYIAEFTENDLLVSIKADGISESDFINIVQKLLD